MKPTTIGIVGTGRMATVLSVLCKRNPSYVIKQASSTKSIDMQTIYPLTEVLESDIVFLAIPISSFKQFINKIASQLENSQGIFIDICSVKVNPAKWMKTILPNRIDCVASHPIFGPQSTKNGTFFEGLPWIFSPIRVQDTTRFDSLITFLKNQKIEIHMMSPREHDQLMSTSQAISFLFGTIGKELGLKQGKFDTKGFSCILQNQHIVEGD